MHVGNNKRSLVKPSALPSLLFRISFGIFYKKTRGPHVIQRSLSPSLRVRLRGDSLDSTNTLLQGQAVMIPNFVSEEFSILSGLLGTFPKNKEFVLL